LRARASAPARVEVEAPREGPGRGAVRGATGRASGPLGDESLLVPPPFAALLPPDRVKLGC